MSQLKYCQGPDCHKKMTDDRIRGMKGAKYYQTRTVGRYGYGNKNFCTLNCYNDWADEFMDRAVDHFGRVREPIKLVPENAWMKDYSWGNDNNQHYYFINKLTKEQIILTKAQWYDSDYTIERARQT
tara:strand:+ start:157 stop:537 length:381 start_codon:yes stop_codon:yes gene_type:complete